MTYSDLRSQLARLPSESSVRAVCEEILECHTNDGIALIIMRKEDNVKGVSPGLLVSIIGANRTDEGEH